MDALAMGKTFSRQKLVKAVLLIGVVMLFGACLGAAASATTYGGATSVSKTFPWTQMLMALVSEMTGPLPRIFGVLGIIAAAIALFAGNGGAGTQKFIILIFTISIALFAPTFVSWLTDSASAGSGATIYEAVGTAVSTAGL